MSKQQISLFGKNLIDTIKSVKIIIEQTEKSKPFIYTKNGDGKTAQLIEAVNNVKDGIVSEKPYREGKRFYLNSLSFDQAMAIIKMAQLPFLRFEIVPIREGLVIK